MAGYIGYNPISLPSVFFMCTHLTLLAIKIKSASFMLEFDFGLKQQNFIKNWVGAVDKIAER